MVPKKIGVGMKRLRCPHLFVCKRRLGDTISQEDMCWRATRVMNIM